MKKLQTTLFSGVLLTLLILAGCGGSQLPPEQSRTKETKAAEGGWRIEATSPDTYNNLYSKCDNSRDRKIFVDDRGNYQVKNGGC